MNISIGNKKKEYLEFKAARSFVRSLKLNTQADWLAYCKSGNKPNNIPGHPHIVYKNDGWVNNGDWIGTGTLQTSERKYREFEKLKSYVKQVGIKTSMEWFEFCKSKDKPQDIPTSVHTIYKDQWKGWKDFLGNE